MIIFYEKRLEIFIRQQKSHKLFPYFVFSFVFAISPFVATAQEKGEWFFESAVRLTGDAEMYFIGPSWNAGAGRSVGKKWTMSTSYTYFSCSRALPGMPKEKYKTNTLDLILNFNFLSLFKDRQGWYAGGGVAWQSRYEIFFINNTYLSESKDYFTSAYNVGYRFPVKIKGKPRSLSIDIKATGAYREKTSIEILTQVMMGVRLRY